MPLYKDTIFSPIVDRIRHKRRLLWATFIREGGIENYKQLVLYYAHKAKKIFFIFITIPLILSVFFFIHQEWFYAISSILLSMLLYLLTRYFYRNDLFYYLMETCLYDSFDRDFQQMLIRKNYDIGQYRKKKMSNK